MGKEEDEFSERVDDLRQFYSATPNEAASQLDLPPILDSLCDLNKAYSDEVYITQGGEKKIYCVMDKRTDRTVALARPVDQSSNEQKECFLREARLTAALAHPNIMPVYEIGLEEGASPFFTMEFISGDTLEDIIRKLDSGDEVYRSRYTQLRLLEMFLKLCDAVAYAHSKGVLHLDIKPANIAVGDFGEVLLCDWGLSRVLTNKNAEKFSEDEDELELLDADILNDITLTGVVKGSPGYMAPEQAEINQVTDFRTDIYALGAVLYTMMSYCSPIKSASPDIMIQDTISGAIMPLYECVEGQGISEGVKALINKALKSNPEERYTSVSELKADVLRYLDGYAPQAQDAGFMKQFILRYRRNRSVFALMFFFVFIIASIIAGAFIKINNEKTYALEAEALAKRTLNDLEDEQSGFRRAVMNSSNSGNYLYPHQSLQAIERLLEREIDSDHRRALLLRKAEYHIVLMEFKKAQLSYDQIENKNFSKLEKSLKNLAATYAAQEIDSYEDLMPSQLADLIESMPSKNKVLAYYTFYFYTENHSDLKPDVVLPTVKNILDLLNNVPHSRVVARKLKFFETEPGRWSLSLEGTPYAIFKLPIALDDEKSNILNMLKLSALDLTYTHFTDPERLFGIEELKELNIRGVKALSQHQINWFLRMGIEKIYHRMEPEQIEGKDFGDIELIKTKGYKHIKKTYPWLRKTN